MSKHRLCCSSLFAEAIHSLADVGNQVRSLREWQRPRLRMEVLLRTGVLQALKGPTKMYNYGHSREKFVWSLISAVGVFFLGAGVSLLHGIQGIWSPRQLEDTMLVFYGKPSLQTMWPGRGNVTMCFSTGCLVCTRGILIHCCSPNDHVQRCCETNES